MKRKEWRNFIAGCKHRWVAQKKLVLQAHLGPFYKGFFGQKKSPLGYVISDRRVGVKEEFAGRRVSQLPWWGLFFRTNTFHSGARLAVGVGWSHGYSHNPMLKAPARLHQQPFHGAWLGVGLQGRMIVLWPFRGGENYTNER